LCRSLIGIVYLIQVEDRSRGIYAAAKHIKTRTQHDRNRFYYLLVESSGVAQITHSYSRRLPALGIKKCFPYKYPALPVEFQKIEIEILFQGDGGNRNTGELKESIHYTVLPRI